MATSKFHELFESVYPDTPKPPMASAMKWMLIDHFRAIAEKKRDEIRERFITQQNRFKRTDPRYKQNSRKINEICLYLRDLEYRYGQLENDIKKMDKQLSIIVDELMEGVTYVSEIYENAVIPEIDEIDRLYKHGDDVYSELFGAEDFDGFNALFEKICGPGGSDIPACEKREMLKDHYYDLARQKHLKAREEYLNEKAKRLNENTRYKEMSAQIDLICKKIKDIENEIKRAETEISCLEKSQIELLAELGDPPNDKIVVPEIDMINKLYNKDREMA